MKTRFIRESFEVLESILGKLHKKSNVYVQFVLAASYGFAGLTQEYRYQHNAPLKLKMSCQEKTSGLI